MHPYRSTVVHRQRLALLVVVLAAFIPAAHELPAQPLDSLIERALDVHPTFEARRLAIAQVDARARAALAWEAPMAGVEFSMLPPDNPNPFTRGETMLMVEQMIPLFGQNRAMARAMRSGEDVATAALRGAERDLRARVEREYYTLWLIERRQELDSLSIDLLDVLYKAVEARYVVDRAQQSQLLSVRLEIERLAADLEELRAEKTESISRLNALLARPLDTPIDPVNDLALDSLPPYQSLADEVASHPMIQMKEAEARMAVAEAEAAESMLDPMLTLRGGVAWMPQGHPVRQEMLASLLGEHGVVQPHTSNFGLRIGAMISLPFVPWSRGGPEARAEALRLESQQMVSERDAVALDMQAELRAAYIQAQRAKFRLRYYRDRQLPLLEQTLETQRMEYSTGTTSFSMMLDTYRMLIMTRTDAYMEQMNYAMARSMVREVAGKDEG